MKLLDDMTKMIIDDCKKIGIKDYQIEHYLKTQLCQNPNKDGDYILFAYNLNGNDGYSITNWERGRCNFGFGAKEPMDFRFLFQLNIVNNFHSYAINEKTKLRAEEFMAKMKPMFGETPEYQKALNKFTRTWNDFEVSLL